jgi:hypothetical protein
MRYMAVWVLTTSMCAASSATLGAQSMISTFPSRFSAGGDFAIAQPKGEFASNVPTGYGFDLNGMLRIDPRGYFNLRVDGGAVQYGRESQHVPFPNTGRVTADLETTNSIAFGSLGTQLQIPDGWFRPYANAAIALTYFNTKSTLSSRDNSFDPISSDNLNDVSHAWIFGGGVTIPFGKSMGALNLGARYHYGARARYLRKGDITDTPGGGVILNVRESKTDLVLWQIGVAFTIPQSNGR